MYVYGVCVCVRCMCMCTVYVYIYISLCTTYRQWFQTTKMQAHADSLFFVLARYMAPRRGGAGGAGVEATSSSLGQRTFFVYSNLGHLLCLILSSVRWHGMSKIGSVSSSRHIMQWLTNHRNESEVCVAGWHHHPWSEYNLGWRRLERSSNKTWENMSVFEKKIVRLQWLQDGSGQCDIVAGGVDATGVFKGIYVPWTWEGAACAEENCGKWTHKTQSQKNLRCFE